MSIAEDEAERVYPTRYWDGTHVKEKFYCEAAKRHRLTLRWRPWPQYSLPSSCAYGKKRRPQEQSSHATGANHTPARSAT